MLLVMSFMVDEQGERNNQALMTENRFDPKDVHKENWYGWTQMIRFCCLGDLALCQYSVVRIVVDRPIVVSMHGSHEKRRRIHRNRTLSTKLKQLPLLLLLLLLR